MNFDKMTTLSWNIIFATFGCFLHLVNANLNETSIEGQIREIFGDVCPVPDFYFLTKGELDDYININKDPVDQTFIKTNILKGKIKDFTEDVLVRTLADYKLGKYKDEITALALTIYNTLYNKSKTTETAESVTKTATKTLTNLFGDETAEDKKNNKTHEHLKRNNDHKRKDFPQGNKSLFSRLIDSVRDYLFHSSGSEEKMEDTTLISTSDNVIQLPSVQIGETACYNKLLEGSDSKSRKLCGFCVKSLDYGDNVIPRYGFSVECNSADASCLGGDGRCFQRSANIRLIKSTTYSNGSIAWSHISQRTNISCECECIAGSTMDSLFASLP